MCWISNGEGNLCTNSAPPPRPGKRLSWTWYTSKPWYHTRSGTSSCHGQPSTPPVPTRDPGQTFIRHFRCGETFCHRHGRLACGQDRQRRQKNSTFVDYCNVFGIRRELTAPYTPEQNSPVEREFSRAIKPGHALRIEVNKLFPDIHLETMKGVRNPDGSCLWLEYTLWACKGFNRSATTANSRIRCPQEAFYGGAARQCRFCRSSSQHIFAFPAE